MEHGEGVRSFIQSIIHSSIRGSTTTGRWMRSWERGRSCLCGVVVVVVYYCMCGKGLSGEERRDLETNRVFTVRSRRLRDLDLAREPIIRRQNHPKNSDSSSLGRMFGLWEREREILDRFCVISSHKTSTKLVVGGWWLLVDDLDPIRAGRWAGLGWAGILSDRGIWDRYVQARST